MAQVTFDLTDAVSPPSAEGEPISLAKNVASTGGAAAPSTYRCHDCGFTVKLLSDRTMDQALNHWKECQRPSADTIERRERYGLDPTVLPLSPSRLTTFELCPRMEWYQTQDPERVKMASGAPADLGTALHTYAETGEDPPHNLPLEFVDDWEWMKRTIDRVKSMTPEQEFAEFREHRMAWTYSLPDGRVAKFVGKSDRVLIWADASIEAYDYKSGRKVLTAEQINDDEQTKDYLVGLRRDFPFGKRYRFHQAQLRFGEVESTEWFEPATIDVWDKLLAAKAVRYSQEKLWAPTPGKHCSFCDFAHRCPAGQTWEGSGARVVVLDSPAIIDSDESVQQAHEILMRTQPVLKQLREAIEKYVARTGPVNVQGGSYDTVTAERTRLKDKPAGFKRLVEKLGSEREAWELFNFNHTSGGKYLEPNGKNTDPELAKNTYTYREDSIKFVPDKEGKKK